MKRLIQVDLKVTTTMIIDDDNGPIASDVSSRFLGIVEDAVAGMRRSDIPIFSFAVRWDGEPFTVLGNIDDMNGDQERSMDGDDSVYVDREGAR